MPKLNQLPLAATFLALVCISFTVPAQALDPRFKPWAAVKTPVEGPAEIIGSYSAGCLVGAVELPPSPSYRRIRNSKGLHYGHPQMIRYLQDVADEVAAKGLPPVGIEDISGARGGPALEGHMSHQTGLDVDLSLELIDKTEEEFEKHVSHVFVKASNIRELKPTWKPEHQEALIAIAADHVDVDRIFVAPAIKKHFCGKYPDAPWLHKLRAMDGHDDHIHVRLKPPGHGSTDPGTGPKQCGRELEPHFEMFVVTDKSKNLPPYRGPYPKLPAICEQLLVK